MNYFSKMNCAVCTAALLTGTAAAADVTAADVWANWQENLEIYGDGLSIGSEDASGDTLTISDLTLSMAEDGDTVTANLGTIVFTELGDGTVSVTMDESYPINLTIDGVDIVANVIQSNMEMIVSGTPEEMNYGITADSYGIEVNEFDDVAGEIRLVMNNVSGGYGVTTGEMRALDYAISAASVDLLVDVAEPGGEAYVIASGKIDALDTSFGADIPLDIDYDNPEEMFANGFSFSGGYEFGGAQYLFDVNADGESFAGTASIGTGGLAVSLDSEEISYSTGTANVAIDLQSNQLPFPISVSASEYALGFFMPVGTSDEPSEFGTNIALRDFAINDEIWSMLDPAGNLGRDPATIALAVDGTGRWFFDLLDPEQADAMAFADVPGELNSLNLSELTVSLAGALLTGTGAFTINNDDLETFGGVPAPVGEVNLELTGANALIDKLVAMGLLPEDQAMMGRMMMGMFARTTGDDQLSSKLEITADGQVLANGQRIQ